jgi:tetratricopeptide (TPR) repeat protein
MVDKEKLNIAEVHFENGYKLLVEGKFEEAIEAYKISIEVFPSAKSYTYLAWAYSRQGRYEEAVNECYNAICTDPGCSTAYNDIGCYFMSLGRYSEAVDWLEKAIRLEDNETRYHPLCNLALILEKKGEWLKAMSYYNRALMLNPDFEAAQNGVLRLTTLLN